MEKKTEKKKARKLNAKEMQGASGGNIASVRVLSNINTYVQNQLTKAAHLVMNLYDVPGELAAKK